MPPREPSDDTQQQISVRLPVAWLEALDRLAAAMSRPGIDLTRANALRAAVARGIEELSKELGVTSATSATADPKKPASKKRLTEK